MSNLKTGKMRRNIEKLFDKEVSAGNIDVEYWQKEKFETVTIESHDKLKLVGAYKDFGNDKLAIIVHGLGGKHDLMTEYAKLFQQMSFDILAIDLRSHGKSEGNEMTMGQEESKDVLLWVGKATQLKSNYKIVLFGVSLGATSVSLLAGEDLPSVKAIVEDCGFNNASTETKFVYSKSKLKSKFIYNLFINYLSKTHGIDLKKVDVASKVKNAKIPVLVIHGDKDDFVPTQNGYEIFDALPEDKRDIKIIKGAGHVESIVVDKNGYKNKIKEFLNKYIS
jgi:hypothetical protein